MRHNLQTMHLLAEEKGIKFLSKEYLGVSELHQWECSKGHNWYAQPSNIKYIPYGKCPKCSGKAKLTIEQINTIIESKEGKLLSEGFQRGKDYIKIQCKNNHIWDTQVFNIRHGKWCPHCGGSFPLNINILKEVAEKRGGKCLSPEYTNANAWYLWQCSEGHTWKAKYGNIYSGNWCKQCIGSTGERICRIFFEQIFKKEFPSVFPEWLKNKSGRRLQLDGFNEELKIAFEHQGEQHFKKTTIYSKDDKSLHQRIKYDNIKRNRCKEKGITLIEVPEINKKIKVKELKEFLIKEFIKNGIVIPLNIDQIEIDYNDAYKTPLWKEKLNRQKDIARSKEGECLSDYYEGNNIKLKYRCKNNHEWDASPQKISLGRWCPKCSVIERANKKRGNIEEMQKLALNKGGICLSTEYIGCDDKLNWQCKQKHSWQATPSSIKNGTWCPTCYRNRPKKTSISLVNNENQLKLKL